MQYIRCNGRLHKQLTDICAGHTPTAMLKCRDCGKRRCRGVLYGHFVQPWSTPMWPSVASRAYIGVLDGSKK